MAPDQVITPQSLARVTACAGASSVVRGARRGVLMNDGEPADDLIKKSPASPGFLSRNAVQHTAYAFDDVLGGDDAAGRIPRLPAGRPPIFHRQWFSSAVPVKIFCGATAFGRQSRRLCR